MEQLLHKRSIAVTETVLDAHEEYAISGDCILPEYCPDVAVVLKCVITPQIQSRRWNGDAFSVDGMAVMRILYLDEERTCIREAEFTQPINCTLRGKSGCETLPVRVWMTQDYINCRAVSPRRVEVRAGFTMHARAERSADTELPDSAAQARLYTKQVSKAFTAPLSSGEKILTVNETLAFDGGLPAAEQLLGGECSAAVTEVKLLTDKAIVKGQIYLHQLYTDDSVNGSTYVLEYTVPFSAIMDVEGVCDGQLHTAYVSVLSDTEECVAGESGQNCALAFTAKLLVQLFTYEKVTAQLLTDAYHLDCPVTVSVETVTMCSLSEAFRQTATVQKNVALPSDGLREIIDVWAMPLPTDGCVQNGRVEMTAPMLLSLLVRDADGTVAYYERPEDFRVEWLQTVICDESAVSVKAYPSVMGLSYAAVGDKLDLRLTLSVGWELWETASEQIMKDIVLQSENAYPADTTAMRLYYADAGERVWDIARRCRTSPDAVREENDLRDEVLTDKAVLLIPKI